MMNDGVPPLDLSGNPVTKDRDGFEADQLDISHQDSIPDTDLGASDYMSVVGSGNQTEESIDLNDSDSSVSEFLDAREHLEKERSCNFGAGSFSPANVVEGCFDTCMSKVEENERKKSQKNIEVETRDDSYQIENKGKEDIETDSQNTELGKISSEPEPLENKLGSEVPPETCLQKEDGQEVKEEVKLKLEEDQSGQIKQELEETREENCSERPISANLGQEEAVTEVHEPNNSVDNKPTENEESLFQLDMEKEGFKLSGDLSLTTVFEQKGLVISEYNEQIHEIRDIVNKLEVPPDLQMEFNLNLDTNEMANEMSQNMFDKIEKRKSNSSSSREMIRADDNNQTEPAKSEEIVEESTNNIEQEAPLEHADSLDKQMEEMKEEMIQKTPSQLNAEFQMKRETMQMINIIQPYSTIQSYSVTVHDQEKTELSDKIQVFQQEEQEDQISENIVRFDLEDERKDIEQMCYTIVNNVIEKPLYKTFSDVGVVPNPNDDDSFRPFSPAIVESLSSTTLSTVHLSDVTLGRSPIDEESVLEVVPVSSPESDKEYAKPEDIVLVLKDLANPSEESSSKIDPAALSKTQSKESIQEKCQQMEMETTLTPSKTDKLFETKPQIKDRRPGKEKLSSLNNIMVASRLRRPTNGKASESLDQSSAETNKKFVRPNRVIVKKPSNTMLHEKASMFPYPNRKPRSALNKRDSTAAGRQPTPIKPKTAGGRNSPDRNLNQSSTTTSFKSRLEALEIARKKRDISPKPSKGMASKSDESRDKKKDGFPTIADNAAVAKADSERKEAPLSSQSSKVAENEANKEEEDDNEVGEETQVGKTLVESTSRKETSDISKPLFSQPKKALMFKYKKQIQEYKAQLIYLNELEINIQKARDNLRKIREQMIACSGDGPEGIPIPELPFATNIEDNVDPATKADTSMQVDKSELRNLEAKLNSFVILEKQKNKEILELNNKLKTEVNKRDELMRNLKQKTKEIDGLMKEADDIKSEMKTFKYKYSSLEKQIQEQELEQKIEQQKYLEKLQKVEIEVERKDRQLNELEEIVDDERRAYEQLKAELDRLERNKDEENFIELSNICNQKDELLRQNKEHLDNERIQKNKFVDLICELCPIFGYEIDNDTDISLRYNLSNNEEVIDNIKTEIQNLQNERDEEMSKKDKEIASLRVEIKDRQQLISELLEGHNYTNQTRTFQNSMEVEKISNEDLINALETKKHAISRMERQMRELQERHSNCGMRRVLQEAKIAELEILLANYHH